MKFLKPFFLLYFLVPFFTARAQFLPQNNFSYTNPEQYTIAEIGFSGIETLDPRALSAITGLKVGDKITLPGEDLSNAIKRIWEQKLVGDISVYVTKVENGKVYLNFHLTESPRISKIIIEGIKKSEKDDIKKKINLSLGQVISNAIIKNTKQKIKDIYIDKGFFDAQVNISLKDDSTLVNKVVVRILVEKGKRVRINKILIHGNEEPKNKEEAKLLSDAALKHKLKDTKEKVFYKFFTSSKFLKDKFEKDKEALIDYYNSLGYRDAKIVSDSVYPVEKNKINIAIDIYQGPKYYFRNITWQGNYIYSDRALDTILSIHKGEIYSLAKLEKKLNYNPNGYDISSLYLDDGYLFFHIEPVEVLVENDSIDIEMRIYEGPQATIKDVTVSGNTKTHDHVILRELRTLPGQKFSRSDLIRSQREISTLGYFDPEKIGINPVPNPADGTVDINYTVVEKPSDQIQLSGGWGGLYGFVGTLGVVFNNFSIKNIPHVRSWDPLPSGDGQRLSVRFQANGPSYQTYSASFTEPWLGGKKPHSLTISLTRSQQSRLDSINRFKADGYLRVQGVSVSFGKRLKWPDDWFSINYTLSYTQYKFKNYGNYYYNFLNIDNAVSHNISFTTTISRNSLNDLTFPTSGSSISLQMIFTPPYSVFNHKDYATMTKAEKYKFVEFNKYMFDNSWYTTLVPGKKRNLVLHTRLHFGYIGAYKKSTGVGPFERFMLGGSGLSGYNYILGSEIIGLRGYQNNTIKPTSAGGTIYDKFVVELRYPLNLSPALSVIALTFFEGGNNWNNFSQFDPLNVYRAAGVGTRIMMPAFGTVGVDWGYRLDNIPGYNPAQNRTHVTFMIGHQLR